MRRILAIWDFLFGTVCIGSAPVIAVYGTRVAAGHAVDNPGRLDGLIGTIGLAGSSPR